ncbi:oligoendopeptidase F [Lactobacillus sp. S2-2]|uniref:oligoendopeptidase F n=1 Tax=Lactobacillus sp. S2-2 TaxID=2692917 RepID=UPI00272DC8F4|nr:oligoendopeptidase F [Lactobacillus sp. S2-2]
MENHKKTITRNDVPKDLTWDLTTIFKDEEEFELSFNQVFKQVEKLSDLKGTLSNSANDLLFVIKKIFSVNRLFEKLFVYAELKSDVDTSNSKNQGLVSRVESLATKVDEAQSWFEPEILKLNEDTIESFYDDNQELKEYQQFISDLFELKEHTLSDNKEKLLAQAANVLNSPAKIFGILDSSDFKFPNVKNETGEETELTNGIYSILLESTNVEVRKNAFKKLYEVYNQFNNTLATTLSSHVQKHNFEASIRKYDSSKQASVSANHIPESVYDNLIKVVNDNLNLLHRYVALRKKVLGLKEMHMYDLYTPLVGEPKLKYTYDSAKNEALKALSVFGKEYTSALKHEFDDRWIDVVENKGKRTGAYSSGTYDTNPYILLNWQDNLDNLYTLVHESGHSMHSYFTTKNQPYQYGDYPIFLAEIASTTNENILTDYLLENTNDKDVKKYILNSYLDGFKGTIFRQTQFAEFELFIHEQEQKGIPLTAEMLNREYKKLNQKYYGDSVISDDEIGLEWSRIPHFYYNFYVYQYATGFAAAINLARGINNKDEKQIEKYLEFLKSGSSKNPIEVMKNTGVDMTSSNYLSEAFKEFENRLDQLESML